MLAVDAWAKGDFIASYTSTLGRLWVTASGKFLSLWLQGSFLAAVMGCMDTLKELAVVAREGCQGPPCACGVGLRRSGYFPRRARFFPEKVSSLPSVRYHPADKTLLSPCFRASHPFL